VSIELKRWAQLAREFQFSQLDIARKQAGTWRTGLAALTTLLTAVLVIKGRGVASTLTSPLQIVVAGLLALALLLLLTATMWVTRALAGRVGEEILLTGEALQWWTAHEVRKLSKALYWVPWMAAASIIAVAAAVGVTWFAPAASGTPAPLVQVSETDGQTVCGTFIGETQHQVILGAPAATPGNLAAFPDTTASGRAPLTTYLPLASVLAITPVTTCR
jgi:hypothetical protein